MTSYIDISPKVVITSSGSSSKYRTADFEQRWLKALRTEATMTRMATMRTY